MMTPRQALEALDSAISLGSPEVTEALTVLERLVSKDEADRKFYEAQKTATLKGYP